MAAAPTRAQGAALIICLILLLALTLLGLAYMRGATLDVLLTGNQEQSLALQHAAENAVAAAVRDGNTGISTTPSTVLLLAAQFAMAHPTDGEDNAFFDFKRCLSDSGALVARSGAEATTPAASIACATALGERGLQAWVTVEWQGCRADEGNTRSTDPNAPRTHYFKLTGTAQYPDGSASAAVEQYVKLQTPLLCPPALRQISR